MPEDKYPDLPPLPPDEEAPNYPESIINFRFPSPPAWQDLAKSSLRLYTQQAAVAGRANQSEEKQNFSVQEFDDAENPETGAPKPPETASNQPNFLKRRLIAVGGALGVIVAAVALGTGTIKFPEGDATEQQKLSQPPHRAPEYRINPTEQQPLIQTPKQQ